MHRIILCLVLAFHDCNVTPLIPKIHPKIHPESPPETKVRKKFEKNTQTPDFRICFIFYRVFWFREGIQGAFWGSEAFCILYGAQEIAKGDESGH